MRPFGHTRPIRDGDGAIIGTVASPAKARTLAPLGTGHGPDSRKRLVVSLERGDIISLRPERTRRCAVIPAGELYTWLLRIQAEKHAAEKKAKRAAKYKLA